MAEHQMDLAEKDELVQKLRSNVKILKDKVKQKTDNSDLINIYEQQLNEKDELIDELNTKFGKLNDTFVDHVENKDEEITVGSFQM